MQKILLMTFEYPLGKEYCGGVGQMVQLSRQALLDLGYEVYVLVSREFRKNHLVKVLGPDGMLMHYPSFFFFEKKLPLKKFDLIIQHFVNWTNDFKRLKSGGSKRPKIIYHFHSILRREKDSGFRTFNRFLLNQEKMIQLADHIICPSRYEYDNFNRYFPYFSDKITLIENVVNVFRPQKNAIEIIKARYSIKAHDIVSLYVGRIERAKGAHILIEHLPHALKRHKNLKIFMIGKSLERGIYRKLANLQKEYPKQIFYIKYLEKNLLFQYYHLSDIYINPSLSESFSLSTHEGAFCKNALLLNRLPVFERFRKGAFFFSPWNSNGDGFSHQFETLMKNKPLRQRLSQNAFKVAHAFILRRDLKKDFAGFIKNIQK
ncbi:MAG: glycosyltransferase family 4 protein [Candidatus Omnitrophota bacterium]